MELKSAKKTIKKITPFSTLFSLTMDSVEWRASSGWNDEQMIHFVKTYNNRTCPLEGDLVEVAVKHGLTVFLDFLLDEEDEVLEQKHMKVAITMISKFRTQRKVTMLKYLVGRDLKVNGYVRGMSYLAHEVACGNVTVVRTLLGLGANVNAKDKKGYTPLMACKDAPTKKSHPVDETSPPTWRGREDRTRRNPQRKSDLEHVLVSGEQMSPIPGMCRPAFYERRELETEEGFFVSL